MKSPMILAAAVAACVVFPSGASAKVYGPAPCPPAVACPPARTAYLVQNTTSCYRTTSNPCLNPIQGVGSVLGKIFSPACNDTCQPCVTCP